MIQDIKRRYKVYLSDLKDGLHIQCVASIIFLYFACITPIVTFGGLLGDGTGNYMVPYMIIILQLIKLAIKVNLCTFTI